MAALRCIWDKGGVGLLLNSDDPRLFAPTHPDVEMRTPTFEREGERFAITVDALPLCPACCQAMVAAHLRDNG